jgi:TetR/AcrR family transcriptional repressor of nem operon
MLRVHARRRWIAAMVSVLKEGAAPVHAQIPFVDIPLDSVPTGWYVVDMTTVRRRSPPHPPRGSARTALLDAALGLVRRQGWAGTSVDQLCVAARVTKGAFFHHFASKDELGVAAAHHWSDVTGPLFATADYHRLADPLARIIGYLDFRAAIAIGPTEAFTCFAGTTVQEVFATSDPIRVACADAIFHHAEQLVGDFQGALERHPPRMPLSAETLATYTQTVLQGGFVLAKARGDHTPLLEAIDHLKRYLNLLFGKEPKQ